MFKVLEFKPQEITTLYPDDKYIVHLLTIYNNICLIYFVCIGLDSFAKEGETEGRRQQKLRGK